MTRAGMIALWVGPRRRLPLRVSRSAFAAALLLLLSMANAAAAQRGPADVITGARNARDARELQQAADRGANPPGDAPNIETGAPAPNNAEPKAADQAPRPSAPHSLEEPGERQPIATEHADTSLPDGTIVVRVIDRAGAPAAVRRRRARHHELR